MTLEAPAPAPAELQTRGAYGIMRLGRKKTAKKGKHCLKLERRKKIAVTKQGLKEMLEQLDASEAIAVIKEMQRKGILHAAAAYELGHQGWLGFYKFYYARQSWHKQFVPVVKINADADAVQFHANVADPVALLSYLVQRHRERLSHVAELSRKLEGKSTAQPQVAHENENENETDI